MTDEELLAKFDHWPSFHPDATEWARLKPDVFKRWGEEVNSGQRTWHAREENF